MLKKAAKDNLGEIAKFCEDSIIGTKILCLVSCYGLERDFLEVWYSEKENRINGIILRFYDDISLHFAEDCDFYNLNIFLNMLHFKTLTCSEAVYKHLNYQNFIIRKGYEFFGEASYSPMVETLNEDTVKEAYNLICDEIPDSFKKDRDSYLSFLSDFTFRSMRNRARGVCIKENNSVLSTALTSSETDSSAIISGVSCRKDIQKKGLGKVIVHSIAAELSKLNKRVYVIALNKSAEGFYEHIGFKEKENIVFFERI